MPATTIHRSVNSLAVASCYFGVRALKDLPKNVPEPVDVLLTETEKESQTDNLKFVQTHYLYYLCKYEYVCLI